VSLVTEPIQICHAQRGAFDRSASSLESNDLVSMTAARTSGSAGAHLPPWCADHQRGHIGLPHSWPLGGTIPRVSPISEPSALVVAKPRDRGPAERGHRPAALHPPSTVKVHLSHIFTKLGITTRAELAGQAASRT
jgi:hypothetical protein